MRENKKCPLSGVTSYGRVWRKCAGKRVMGGTHDLSGQCLPCWPRGSVLIGLPALGVRGYLVAVSSISSSCCPPRHRLFVVLFVVCLFCLLFVLCGRVVFVWRGFGVCVFFCFFFVVVLLLLFLFSDVFLCFLFVCFFLSFFVCCCFCCFVCLLGGGGRGGGGLSWYSVCCGYFLEGRARGCCFLLLLFLLVVVVWVFWVFLLLLFFVGRFLVVVVCFCFVFFCFVFWGGLFLFSFLSHLLIRFLRVFHYARDKWRSCIALLVMETQLILPVDWCYALIDTLTALLFRPRFARAFFVSCSSVQRIFSVLFFSVWNHKWHDFYVSSGNGKEEVFVLTWEIRSIRVSANEQNCLEGVYTVRRPEKQAGDESEKTLWQIVNSLLSSLAWTGNQWRAFRRGCTWSCLRCRVLDYEPVWPSGKALGW